MVYRNITSQENAFGDAPQRQFWKDTSDLQRSGRVFVNPLTVCGMSISFVPKGADPVNDYAPAYGDLMDFERSVAPDILASEVGFILHRMGYFTSLGKRDFSVFYRDGRVETHIYRQNGTDDCKYNTMGEAMSQKFNQVLRESPDAVFFLHRPGYEVDFNLISLLFEGIPYRKVGDQTWARDIDIPLDQMKNVASLGELEKSSPLGIVTAINQRTIYREEAEYNIKRRAFTFFLEEDPAEYWIMVDGSLFGISAKSGIPQKLAIVVQTYPKSNVLVHRMGDTLDFKLADKSRDSKALEIE